MAFETLANNLSENLQKNDDFMIFLLKQCLNYKLTTIVHSLIDTLIKIKTPKNNKELLISIADIILTSEGNKNKALEIFKQLFEAHGSYDKVIQSRYLNLLVDVNLNEAIKVQQKLNPPINIQEQDDEYLT